MEKVDTMSHEQKRIEELEQQLEQMATTTRSRKKAVAVSGHVEHGNLQSKGQK